MHALQVRFDMFSNCDATGTCTPHVSMVSFAVINSSGSCPAVDEASGLPVIGSCGSSTCREGSGWPPGSWATQRLLNDCRCDVATRANCHRRITRGPAPLGSERVAIVRCRCAHRRATRACDASVRPRPSPTAVAPASAGLHADVIHSIRSIYYSEQIYGCK